ncbi:MAG: PKD domain-containing protein, partial [Methanoregula sp.]|nr:PKD domain-containing protein [Methanoregula sp.]
VEKATTGGDLGKKIWTGRWHCDLIEPHDVGIYEYTCENDINSPTTANFPFTLPAGINASRISSISLDLGGFGDAPVFYPGGSCNTSPPDSGCARYSLNGVALDNWWGGDVDPALLQDGINTLSLYNKPEKSEARGTTVYNGFIWTTALYVSIHVPYDPAEMPQLDDLEISPDILLTGHDITVNPVISGESSYWEIVDISYYVLDAKTGKQEHYEVLPANQDLVYRPAPGAYGEKALIAEMQVRNVMTGREETTEMYYPITIYFDKGLYPGWVDDDADGRPNWLEYWAQDGAVPLLDNTVRYNASGTGYGVSYGGGVIELEPLAATQHYNTPIVIPDTAISPAPAGESFGGPTVVGIDCAAEVIAHERYHDWVSAEWLPGGTFNGQPDSDFMINPGGGTNYRDRLPDDYETNTSMTDPTALTDTYDLATLKGDDYAFYGDQEYMAMRAGDGGRGVADNDWAYPGKKVARQVIAGINPPAATTCRGRCDIYAPSLPAGVFAGIVETPADTDANSLYNSLTAGNDISISRSGHYTVTAVLRGGAGDEVIAVQQNQSAFGAGNYSVSAVFPGTDISSAGVNGPYTVTLTWRHEYQENGVPPSISWQTAPYLSTDFEPVGAVFAGNATATPSVGDLVAAVPLTINRAGEYTIEGYLQDPGGLQMAHAVQTATFPAGAANATPAFDGNVIAAYGRDGTFNLVNFRILDAAGTVVGQRPAAGNVTIDSTQFGSMVTILTDTYSESGAYPDASGRYQVLLVNVSIQTTKNAEYTYSASLYDEKGGHIQTLNGVYNAKSTGVVPLMLEFSGNEIYKHQVNGTYALRSLRVTVPGGTDRRSGPLITRSYQYTAFSRPAILITGNVTDYPVDTDGNGLYDAVRLGFDVETCSLNPGADIPLSADLIAPSTNPDGSFGKPVAHVYDDTKDFLSYRAYHVTLDFPGRVINGTAINGPFLLGTLQAGSTYGGVKPSYYLNPVVPYSTAPYNYTDFEPAAFLAGYVKNEYGLPLDGISLSAMGKTGTTDGGGYYRLFYDENLNGGVQATAPEALNMSSGYQVRSVSLGNTTFCNFTLFSPSQVSGTVTAENGTLLTSGSVHASGPAAYSFSLASWGNGSYQFLKMKNGTYDIAYHPPAGSGLVSNRLTGTEIAPGEDLHWNITAYNARSISGTVRDINGNPLEGAEVSITKGPITKTWPYAPETDTTGAYAFPALIPGNYTLVVTPPWADRDLLVTNTTNITIRLSDTSLTHNIVLTPAAVAPQAWRPDISPDSGKVPLTVSFTDLSKGSPTTWLWQFGDGGTSTVQNPTHTYTVAGSYNITLTVTNAYGTDTEMFEEIVQVTDPRLILPNGTIASGASGKFPLKAADLSGASYVRLILSYDPAIVQLNSVLDNADFIDSIDTSIDNVTGKAAINITFVSMQGFTSPTRLANLSFTAAGTLGQETLLTAHPADQVVCAGGEGCWPGATEIPSNLSVTNGSVRIIGGAGTHPVAAFIATPTSGNAPLLVTFDSSASSVVLPTSYLWAFGDGNTSSNPGPSHTYAAPGSYDVSLTVTNVSGSNTLTKQDYINVTTAPGADEYIFTRKWGVAGDDPAGNGYFQYPTGIAVHPSGIVSVVDSDNGRVQVFAPNGTFMRMYGGNGTPGGEFKSINSLAIDAGGNSFVVDQMGTWIINKYDPNGHFVAGGGTRGTGNSEFQWPMGIAVDPTGNMYIVDSSNNRVQKLGPDGAFITTWGSIGAGNGQFLIPNGVAVDHAG